MVDVSVSNGKRRLSRGGQGITLEIEDEDILNAEFAPIPKSHSAGRRRSSFGGGMLGSKSPVKAAVDQTRIADMYKVIIKMSSENKITAKNSWELDLIDHMGQIIKEETSERGQRGVNFQKASCTLDASVKIYSHRVDDTWTSSYRILENLSRNGNGDEENSDEKGPSRVGSKAISSRNGLTSCLESNKEALNAKVDSDYNADPMFHKMSQAFDEGGAKGMLMNNLRVVPGSSALVFTSEGLAKGAGKLSEGSLLIDPIEPETPVSETSNTMDVDATAASKIEDHKGLIDISVILLKSGISLSGLQSLCVTPALDEYRKSINLNAESYGIFDSSQMNLSEFDSSIESQRIQARTKYSAPSAAIDEDFGCYNEDADVDGEFDYDGGDIDNDSFDDTFVPIATAAPIKASSKSQPVAPKLDWTAAFGGTVATATQAAAPLANVEVTIGNDYTFLNFQSNQSNSWAGARHWKFALRRSERSAAAKSSLDEIQPTVEMTSKHSSSQDKSAVTKSSKEKFFFSFDKCLDFASSFKVEDKKSSSTTLTIAAIEKSNQLAAEGAFILPMDAKLGPKDLCRLFLCPSMIVPPPNLTSIMSSSSNAKETKSIESMTSGRQDSLWGELQPEVRKKLGNFAASAVYSEDQGYGEQVEFFEDDDDDHVSCNEYQGGESNGLHTVSPTSDEPEGLQIRLDGMLQASRKVEKVNIGYSTISKRVNVKNLKSDIWSWIEDHSTDSASTATENKDPNKGKASTKESKAKAVKTEVGSFQEMISNVAVSQQKEKGQEVSVSYYFICLLHLANEKGLQIDGQSDFSDLRISKN